MSTPPTGPDGPDEAGFRDHAYDAERHLPPQHNPLPALTEPPHRHDPTAAEYAEIAATPEFAELRHRFRAFAFPMTAFFLVWYFGYVLLSTYAEKFMGTRIGGSAITVGLVLGVLQFVTTFLITWLYIRHANKSLDPLATDLRDKLEEETR